MNVSNTVNFLTPLYSFEIVNALLVDQESERKKCLFAFRGATFSWLKSHFTPEVQRKHRESAPLIGSTHNYSWHSSQITPWKAHHYRYGQDLTLCPRWSSYTDKMIDRHGAQTILKVFHFVSEIVVPEQSLWWRRSA